MSRNRREKWIMWRTERLKKSRNGVVSRKGNDKTGREERWVEQSKWEKINENERERRNG